jgi:hypothetical protein
MSRISTAFFGAAVLYALSGMALGIVMGESGDHSAAPLHAHINLLGWASLAVMGAFYGIAADRAPRRLAWANFAVSNLGNLLTLAMLALIVQGKPPILPILIPGEGLIVLGMLLFGTSVLLVGRKAQAA